MPERNAIKTDRNTNDAKQRYRMTKNDEENLLLTDYGSSAILPGQQIATVSAHQLPELS